MFRKENSDFYGVAAKSKVAAYRSTTAVAIQKESVIALSMRFRPPNSNVVVFNICIALVKQVSIFRYMRIFY